MTLSTDCSESRILLGVYVLGAIEPSERCKIDTHLRGCRRCRDELASLAGLPAMLARISEEQVGQLEPPPEELLDSTLARAAGEIRVRQRQNRVRLMAAAAALIALTAVGVRTMSQGVEPQLPVGSGVPAPRATVDGSDPSTGVRARVDMKHEEWGTAVRITLSGVPMGARCRLVAIDKNGVEDPAGSWQVQYPGAGSFSGSTMITEDRLAAFEVRMVDGGRRLLRIPV